MATPNRSEQSQRFSALQAHDYAKLLEMFRADRLGRIELQKEAARRRSRLSRNAAEHGVYWWKFYDLPFAHMIALYAHLLGYTEQILECAKAENPAKAFLEAMSQGEDCEQDDVALSDTELSALFNLTMATTYSLEAIGYYSRSINELLQDVEGGNDEALQRAVSVDRMALATEKGAASLARAQLTQKKGVLFGIGKLFRQPHAKRQTYVDLRLMQRLLEEAGDMVTLPSSELHALVARDLRLPAPESEKQLRDLFRDWKKDSTG